jgi:hypothetical protein
MVRTTERFWGHPDDWPDDEWAEYVAERTAKREAEAAKPEPYVPTTEAVRSAYGEHYVRNVEYHEEGFAEFDRWLARVQTDAYFRGAESMCDQTAEDRFDGANVPQFVSLYEEGVEYEDWRKRNGD